MRYHVGMIPDGNRRWAREQGLDPWEGHRRGGEKVELFLDWCGDQEDIAEITIYLLSEENFKRPVRELGKLYELYEEEFPKLINKEKIHQQRVRVNIVSTNSKPVPRSLARLFNRIEAETKDYDNKVLNVLIGYTGQAEILAAISSPSNRIKNLLFGLNRKDLEKSLEIKNPCDFIIRTGEESEEREARSGFLLWQSAYAEYYHVNKYFPDVTVEDFSKAWDYFISTKRKKGL
jgi:tritrans,polycis-undecaprenyl-diphosphate synthase [geranylgeranyl-diphosphate specific]